MVSYKHKVKFFIATCNIFVHTVKSQDKNVSYVSMNLKKKMTGLEDNAAISLIYNLYKSLRITTSFVKITHVFTRAEVAHFYRFKQIMLLSHIFLCP